VGEFYKGAYEANWGANQINKMENWLRQCVVIPYDADVAQKWGLIQAEGKKKGRQIPQNDGWIAACCLIHDLPLMTLNVRHFKDVVGLRLILVEEGSEKSDPNGTEDHEP
jgi:predicted nucleic acid-binding protein